MSLYRAILSGNKFLSQAAELLHKRDFPKALSLLLEAGSDPLLTESAEGSELLDFYTKTALIGLGEFGQLAERLEASLLQSISRKEPEQNLLQHLKNLHHCYLDLSNFERALFLTEEFESVLKRKHFSKHFKSEMALLKTSTLILLSEFDESSIKLLEDISKEFKSPVLKATALNNAGVGHLFLKEAAFKKAIGHFQKSAILLEGLESSASEITENKEENSEAFGVDSNQNADNFNWTFSFGGKKDKAFSLGKFLANPQLNLLGQVKNRLAFIPIANLADVFVKTESVKKGFLMCLLALEKINVKTSALADHRFKFYAYKLGNETIQNKEAVEKYLIEAINSSAIKNSAFREISLLEYQKFLEDEGRNYEAFKVNKCVFDNIKNGNIRCVERQFIDPFRLAREFLLFSDYKLFEG